MEYKNLHLDKRPPLAQVTLDRPKVLNALNAATIAELSEVFEEFGCRPRNSRRSSHRRRWPGLCRGRRHSRARRAQCRRRPRLALRGQDVLRRIETLGKPVIACIQGFALGGGCELAMACTLRLAADDARLGQPEVKLGLMAGYGGTQRLPRLVGRGAALKLLLTGAIIDAHEALRIGLVDEVLPAAELMERAEALALEIAANAPLALADTLRAVDEGIDLPLDLALMREAVRFGHLCGTADKNEGTQAFLEKRTPVWKGE